MDSKKFWPLGNFSTLDSLRQDFKPVRGEPHNKKILRMLQDKNTVLEHQDLDVWLAYSGDPEHEPEAITVEIHFPPLRYVFDGFALLARIGC